jgi:acyl-CoA thioesterase
MPDDADVGQRAVAAMLVGDRASAALGIELIELGPDHARTRMTVRPDMVNGHDIAHGAMVFAVADTAFACACNSAGPVTVAASADVVFVRPAYLGDELVAEAVMRTRWGRHGVCDVTVRRGADVIAEFRGRSAQLATGAAGGAAGDAGGR